MTYAANIQKDHVEVNYLIRIGSRVEVEGSWTNLGSGVWSIPWTDRIVGKITTTWEHPDSLQIEPFGINWLMAPTYSAMATNSTTNGFDRVAIWTDLQNQLLYYNISPNASADQGPNEVDVRVFAERFYFLSTKHIGFHAKPDDSTYPMVQYQGILDGAPQVSASSNQVMYGFSPTQSGQITVVNDGYLGADFFSGSLAKCTFEVYRCVGEIRPENMQFAFRGFTTDVSYTTDKVTISYADSTILLDNTWPNRRVTNSSPDLDGVCRRQLLCGTMNRALGYVSGYDATPGNTVNRTWTFADNLFTRDNNALSVATASYTTDNGLTGSNTLTRTYLDSVSGLVVGQWLYRAATLTMVEISAIGANYIDHSALHDPSTPMGASDSFVMSGVQSMTLVHKDTLVETEVEIGDVASGFSSPIITINQAFEAAKGGIDPLHPTNYYVYGDIVGGCKRRTFLSTGSPLGTINPNTGFYENPVHLIFEILVDAGFGNHSNYFDETSFTDAADAIDIYLSGATPRAHNSFESEIYRDVLAKICETALLKVYMKNGKWYVRLIEPFGAADQTISKIDVKDNGFTYRSDSADIAKEVTVKYDFGEINPMNEIQDHWATSTESSATSEMINSTLKSRVMELYLSETASAETMRDRYLYLFSLPLGFATFSLKLASMGLGLGDVIEVSIEDFSQLPFSTDRKFSVVSIKENEDSIDVEGFDQLGIEENAGSW
jgi:hypothetical protein